MNDDMRRALIAAGFELVTDDLPPVFCWSRGGNADGENDQEIIFAASHTEGHAFMACDMIYPDTRYGDTDADLVNAIRWLDSLRP